MPKSKNIRYKSLLKRITNFSIERDWVKFHNPKDIATALSVEASELLEKFMWVGQNDSRKLFDDPKKREEIEDEVADTYIYLLELVVAGDIDLDVVVSRKMKKNAQKYPVAKSKGNAKKYSEF